MVLVPSTPTILKQVKGSYVGEYRSITIVKSKHSLKVGDKKVFNIWFDMI